MRLGRKGLWLAACCTAILAPAAPAEAKGKIVSQWLDREIIIDGELDEFRAKRPEKRRDHHQGKSQRHPPLVGHQVRDDTPQEPSVEPFGFRLLLVGMLIFFPSQDALDQRVKRET